MFRSNPGDDPHGEPRKALPQASASPVSGPQCFQLSESGDALHCLQGRRRSGHTLSRVSPAYGKTATPSTSLDTPAPCSLGPDLDLEGMESVSLPLDSQLLAEFLNCSEPSTRPPVRLHATFDLESSLQHADSGSHASHQQHRFQLRLGSLPDSRQGKLSTFQGLSMPRDNMRSSRQLIAAAFSAAGLDLFQIHNNASLLTHLPVRADLGCIMMKDHGPTFTLPMSCQLNFDLMQSTLATGAILPGFQYSTCQALLLVLLHLPCSLKVSCGHPLLSQGCTTMYWDSRIMLKFQVKFDCIAVLRGG